METIEVHAIESHVILDGDIPALITAISIRGRNVTYECSWRDECSRKSDWFMDYEFKVTGERRMIGINQVRRD